MAPRHTGGAVWSTPHGLAGKAAGNDVGMWFGPSAGASIVRFVYLCSHFLFLPPSSLFLASPYSFSLSNLVLFPVCHPLRFRSSPPMCSRPFPSTCIITLTPGPPSPLRSPIHINDAPLVVVRIWQCRHCGRRVLIVVFCSLIHVTRTSASAALVFQDGEDGHTPHLLRGRWVLVVGDIAVVVVDYSDPSPTRPWVAVLRPDPSPGFQARPDPNNTIVDGVPSLRDDDFIFTVLSSSFISFTPKLASSLPMLLGISVATDGTLYQTEYTATYSPTALAALQHVHLSPERCELLRPPFAATSSSNDDRTPPVHAGEHLNYARSIAKRVRTMPLPLSGLDPSVLIGSASSKVDTEDHAVAPITLLANPCFDIPSLPTKGAPAYPELESDESTVKRAYPTLPCEDAAKQQERQRCMTVAVDNRQWGLACAGFLSKCHICI
ncbi:hypothetical protein B0H11DRAFT_2247124 [Mycena galericulata]|nr:hypothetical protein B0H11DRAFT_2247124 [Mycena galericulata]